LEVRRAEETVAKNRHLLLRHLARNWIKSAQRSLEAARAGHADPQITLAAELEEARKAHQQAEELLALDA
jgi:hypothetical protein